MKQSKGSKQVKSVRLSRPDGVRDVAMGHRAAHDCKDGGRCKMEREDEGSDDNDMDDVQARRSRYGISW